MADVICVNDFRMTNRSDTEVCPGCENFSNPHNSSNRWDYQCLLNPLPKKLNTDKDKVQPYDICDGSEYFTEREFQICRLVTSCELLKRRDLELLTQ